MDNVHSKMDTKIIITQSYEINRGMNAFLILIPNLNKICFLQIFRKLYIQSCSHMNHFHIAAELWQYNQLRRLYPSMLSHHLVYA